MEWKTDLTVGFVPLPPEKEEAYWAAIQYFAEVMFADLLAVDAGDSLDTEYHERKGKDENGKLFE